jgi:hypothetical protein
MLDKTSNCLTQFYSQSKQTDNPSFSQNTEQNKFFLNSFENQSKQKNLEINTNSLESAKVENQVI